jgi:hypothetical protein
MASSSGTPAVAPLPVQGDAPAHSLATPQTWFIVIKDQKARNVPITHTFFNVLTQEESEFATEEDRYVTSPHGCLDCESTQACTVGHGGIEVHGDCMPWMLLRRLLPRMIFPSLCSPRQCASDTSHSPEGHVHSPEMPHFDRQVPSLEGESQSPEGQLHSVGGNSQAPL